MKSLKGGGFIKVVETELHKDIVEEMGKDPKWRKHIYVDVTVGESFDTGEPVEIYTVYAGSGKYQRDYWNEFFIKRDKKWSKE